MYLFPDPFNIYREMILRELEGIEEFIVGGQNFNNLRYADDTVLIAQSKENLQENGLTINCKKTKCLIISKQPGQSYMF